jgi:hypothetical protein
MMAEANGNGVACLVGVVDEMGSNNDMVRTEARAFVAALRCEAASSSSIWPPAVLVAALIDTAQATRNARTRSECLLQLAELVREHGASALTAPVKLVNTLASFVGQERDLTSKSAALDVLAAAHAVLGQRLWKMLSALDNRSRHIIAQRVERACPPSARDIKAPEAEVQVSPDADAVRRELREGGRQAGAGGAVKGLVGRCASRAPLAGDAADAPPAQEVPAAASRASRHLPSMCGDRDDVTTKAGGGGSGGGGVLGQGCEAADPRPSRQATCSRQEQGQQAETAAHGGGPSAHGGGPSAHGGGPSAHGGGPSANRERTVHGGAVQDAQGTSDGGGLAAIVSSLEQNAHGGPGLADALTRFYVRVDWCVCVCVGGRVWWQSCADRTCLPPNQAVCKVGRGPKRRKHGFGQDGRGG